MSEPFIGEIRMVGFNFAPVNWALCNGALQAISQNETLYQLLGTTYGGDGTQTFNLPNLQGCVPVGQGTGGGGTYVMGEYTGAENVTINASTMPNHTHPVPCNATGNISNPGNAVFAGDPGVALYANPDSSTQLNNAFLSTTGGSQPHTNMMPYGVIKFIIALYGIYPSQG
jgi:microcystin-dependent protein